MRRSLLKLAVAGGLAFGLLGSGTAHASDSGPVTWQSMAGSTEYWNIAGNSLSNGADLIVYPWTGGSNEYFYDVILTDGYRVEETKSSAGGDDAMCVADPASEVNAGIIQWSCGDYEDNWTVQWAENETASEWELVNQSHDQLATWKYDKSQIFLENADSSTACDSEYGLNEICAQFWS